jgi:hypothetical protein
MGVGQFGSGELRRRRLLTYSPAVGAAATTLGNGKISDVTLKGFVPPERFQRSFSTCHTDPGLKQPRAGISERLRRTSFSNQTDPLPG